MVIKDVNEDEKELLNSSFEDLVKLPLSAELRGN